MFSVTGKEWLSLHVWPKVFVVLLLAVIASAINYYRLPLFFSIDFIFGSSIAILALVLLGGTAALFIGCAAAAVTFLIWGHPYAWFVFTLEIVWMAWRFQRQRNKNLVVLDLQFWLFIGLPLTIFLYAIALDAGWSTAGLIGLKQMSNGIFNAILVSLFLLFLQMHKGTSRRFNLPLVTLRQLIFHVIMTLTLLAGSVPLVIDTRNLQQEYQASVAFQLQQLAKQTEKHLQYRAQRSNDIEKQMPLNDMLQAILFNDDVGLVLLNEQKQLVSSVGMVKHFSPANNPNPVIGFSHWTPENISVHLQRWRQSRYVYLKTVPALDGVHYIGVEQPATEVVNKLEQDSARKLFMFFCFLLLAISSSTILSKAISSPLRRLDIASKDIKNNVSNGISTMMPESNVAEYSSISQTLMAMSDELTVAFRLSKASQTELGRQVVERTVELQQTNSQLKAILAAASDFSIIATNPEGIITFFSLGAEKLLGYNAEELVDLQTPAIFHMPSEIMQRAEQLTVKFARPIAGFETFVTIARLQGSETREWSYVRKDGNTVPVSLTVTPILDIKGNVTGYLGVAKDITDFQRAEQLKNDFVSAVSHELRTPLTSIYAALRIVNSAKLGKLPDKVAELMLLAENNSKRLNTLINDLLDIEKLDADKFTMELELQPVAPLVSQVIDDITSYAEQYKVKLQPEFHHTPLFARLDRARFMQIVTNLLSNAIKFSPQGATVNLRLFSEGSDVKLEVCDQGIGIDESFKARIFEKFAQSDVANTRQQGGTGLGLAISKQLTEKMGGQIGFESSAGKGATFWVCFRQADIM